MTTKLSTCKIYPDLAQAMNKIVRKIDFYLQDNDYNGPPINMYLAGGMAVNYYCGTRYTEDVDASFSRRIIFSSEEIVASYVRPNGKSSFIYLDKNYNPTFALMHENFEEDCWPWNFDDHQTETISLRILSPVDLAVSKIARFSEQDRQDIKALAIEKLFTESDLRHRAEDALLNYVGNLLSVKNSLSMACHDVARILDQSPLSRSLSKPKSASSTEPGQLSDLAP